MYDLDNLITDAKKAFDAVSAKTGEVIDLSRSQIEKSQIKVKIKEKYQELGKVCYDAAEFGSEDTTALQLIIADIKALKSELYAIDNALKSSKQVFCGNCGAKNDSGYGYCSRCGKKL